MKKRTLTVVLAVLLAWIMTSCAQAPAEAPPTETPVSAESADYAAESASAEEPEPEEPQPVTATLAVVGDITRHMPVTNDTWNDAAQRYDFGRVFAAAVPYLSQADYAVGNFETTTAGGPNYSGYPAFNAPDALAQDIASAGVDLVLTSNNHCLDKRMPGLCRTLDVLDEVGLAHVGTSRTQEEHDNNISVADIGGISVAFLGYTYGTNGIPLPKDAPYAVNLFNTDYLTSLSTPDTDRLISDLSAAKALDTDLVVVMIHWGTEYRTKQNSYQETIAQLLLDNGADIVLGGHSHVPQPVEYRTVTEPDGTTREGFVCYSLGNFISAQNDPLTDTTAILTLELTKDPITDETVVTNWRYQPMLMLDRESGPCRFELLDVYRSLEDGNIDAGLAEKLHGAVENCHAIWGAEHDAGAAAP